MYQRILNNICIPLYENTFKKRNLLTYQTNLEASQWLSKEQIQKNQLQSLRELLSHAYANVDYWQKLFDGINLKPENIHSYQDFCRLPLLSKQIIREHDTRMLSENDTDDSWSKYTGGSTGNPLRIFYTPESHDNRVASTRRGYAWAGCRDGVKQFYLWGTSERHMSRFAKLKTRIHEAILRHKYFNCFYFDDARKQECVEILNRYQPAIIIGYTNALDSLARYMKANDLKFTFKIQSIISAAEKIHASQRQTIEEIFQAKVFNSYGSREFMLIAMECSEHEGLHLSSENLFVEIIGDDGKPVAPGEQGEIVVTDLHNYAMPLIRYRIGDLAIQARADNTCKCGRGLPMISDVSGRILDMIKLEDGNEVPGEFFVRFIGNKPGVVQYRVIQESLSVISVELVTNHLFTDVIQNAMEKDLRAVLGSQLIINIRFMDQLELTPSGKFRVTISRIQ
ncbi:MAG: AMP-binding protein [Pseudomonadota bacterium]